MYKLLALLSIFTFTSVLPLDLSAQVLKNVLLREKATEVRKDQAKSLKILDGALERLRQKYKPGPNALSSAYEEWKKTYNDFAEQTEESNERVGELDDIANSLFAEWEQEAQSMSDTSLKSKSLKKLESTKDSFTGIKDHLRERKTQGEKVLTHLRDRVLYIKHSLNAESLEALKDESEDIEDDIEELVADMNEALKKLDGFIVTLGSE